MKHDERWRAKRVKNKKERAKALKPQLAQIETTSVSFTFGTIPFDELFLHPVQKSKLEQVVEVLADFELSIPVLRSTAWLQRDHLFGVEYERAIVGCRAMVKPLASSPDATIPLHGSSGSASSPSNAVKLARQYLIGLVTHEIDEWLFKAGIGQNPHNWGDGMIPDQEVGKLPRFGD